MLSSEEGEEGSSGEDWGIENNIFKMEIDLDQNSQTGSLMSGDEQEGRDSHELVLMAVFENEMLRENILKHVIFPNGKINRSRIGNVRLVQKSWLRTVGDLVRKNRECLFHITLTKDNSIDGTPYCNQNGKLLERFNYILNRSICCQLPTYSLRLLPDFFRRENYEDLAECLTSFGGCLLELDLAFPMNSSMTLVFSPFVLPKLNRVSVQFSDQRLIDSVAPTTPQQLQNNGHSVYPLQNIFNATSQLTEVQFKFTTSEMLIPLGFEYLKLPRTIRDLFLDCPLKNQDLEILLKNDLPNLRHLRLFASNNPYAEGLIYRILSKFRGTLKTLNLRGSHFHGRLRNTTLFKLPIMEKLETLTITSQTWELEQDPDEHHPPNWEACLPAVSEIRLLHQSESLFQKWTSRSRFESVARLFVSLINTNINGGFASPMMGEQPLTINLERMQCLHMAFPNVVCLELALCGNQTCGLKYLFMEMRSLQKFAITLRGNAPAADHSQPLHWDSLLIGLPPDMTLSLRRNPDFWNNIELKDDNNFPSIRKLKDLRSLALVENYWGAIDAVGGINSSLISDLSFHFAFLKMPNLKHLLLSGKFRASSIMAEKWRREKGTEIHSISRFS